MTQAWLELPEAVRQAVQSRASAVVVGFEPATAGRHSPLSGTLHLAGGRRLFLKGAELTDVNLWMHRHEASINPWLPRPVAPGLVGQVEQDGWLVLLFEHASGRHANLAPGSADLVAVAEAVSALSALDRAPGPGGRSLFQHWNRLRAWHRLAEQPHLLDPADVDQLPTFLDWEQRALPTLDGPGLAHTDLHSLNILVEPGRARIVDWAWARQAAGWVDPAMLVLRLIEHGHDADEAERWAAGVPSWHAASDAELTGFAVATLGVWEYLRITKPLAHRERLSIVARTWARHRLCSDLA